MEPILALDTAELVAYILAFIMYLVMIYRINRWDQAAWWSLLGLCGARLSKSEPIFPVHCSRETGLLTSHAVGAATSVVYHFNARRRHQRRISGAALTVSLSF